MSITKADAATTFPRRSLQSAFGQRRRRRRRRGASQLSEREHSTLLPTNNNKQQKQKQSELLLASVNVGVLGAVLNIGAAPRPSTLGVVDYGGGVRTLGLCPPSPNCISTAEALNDIGHYVPPL